MQAPDANHLKVLMTADTVGGVWTYCMELCCELASLGVQFYLVTAGAPLQPGQWAEVKKLSNVQVIETGHKLEWMQDPWSDIDGSGAELLELEKELQPDIIHLNSYTYGALPFRAPKVVVAHSDVFSWWRAVHGCNPTPDWDEYFNRVKAGLNGAQLIIAPSGAMMREIKNIYGPDAPNKVVYNYRNAAAFAIGEKRPEVLAMGRIWDEAKNVQLLLKASKHIGYAIKLAGDQAFENNTIDTVGNNIEYLGKLAPNEVATHLSTASVFVLPARYEPFGLSALEAALSGCALVLGNIPSLQEIWEDAAIYVDPDDATSMAVVVNKLLCDTAYREQLAQKALKRARLFSNSAWGKAYLSTYRQLLQQKIIEQETA